MLCVRLPLRLLRSVVFQPLQLLHGVWLLLVPYVELPLLGVVVLLHEDVLAVPYHLHRFAVGQGLELEQELLLLVYLLISLDLQITKQWIK